MIECHLFPQCHMSVFGAVRNLAPTDGRVSGKFQCVKTFRPDNARFRPAPDGGSARLRAETRRAPLPFRRGPPWPALTCSAMAGPISVRRQTLVDLLNRYRPTDVEAESLRAMRRLIAGPGDVLSHRHFEVGHFTASAFVTDESLEHMLLVHHRKLGLWLQPGGHVEPADTSLLAAAIREVGEETGLDATPSGPHGTALFDIDIHAIPERWPDPPHLHHDLRFHLIAPLDPPIVTAEVLDVRWVPISRVGEFADDTSVLRGVDKLTGRNRPLPDPFEDAVEER